MKLLWRLGKEALKYKGQYIVAMLSTVMLTVVNLVAPRVIARATGIISRAGGMTAGEADAGARTLGLCALALVGLYLVRILFRYLSNFLAHRAAWTLVEEIRVRVYGIIQSLSMRFFHNKQTGDLMSRVVNDTATFELLYAHILPEAVTNLTTVAGVLILLFAINPRLALITCIPVPFILFAGRIFAQRIRPNFRRTQKSLGELNAKIHDNFAGIREIQSFNREESEVGNVTDKVRQFTTHMLYALKQSAVFHPTVEFLSSLGTVAVVGLGGFMSLRGELNVEDTVAFLLYLGLFYTPISGLARLLEDMQQAFAGAERVIAVMDESREIHDEPDAVPLANVRGAIEFRDVSFKYEEAMVLKGVSFACAPGQMVALVGPTGVGKTTMTSLISRFYDPTEGQVLVDGQDVRHVTLESLRACISPVLQDTFLFNGSVLENIAYSTPGATREEVESAAIAARIHESILEMPDGYDTQIGERGVKLSGGQKQRLAIARAILRKSPIIILDEATASVDTETEREIQAAINDLSKRCTIVAIAHRLSTIRSADMILVLEDGVIVQRGTHRELLAQDGLYRRLYTAQAELEEDVAAEIRGGAAQGLFAGGTAAS